MAHKKISRNDPCPCGSGKKFKNCCLHKGIDWETRRSAEARGPLPSAAPPPKAEPLPGFAALGPYRVVDAKLKEIAGATPEPAAWKGMVQRLSDATPEEERMDAYRAVRDAGVLPADAAFFLFDHAIQWMPSGEDDLDRHTLAALRRFGLEDMAGLYANDSLEYDRRHERGRQFFFGPPDERLAERLREKGIID